MTMMTTRERKRNYEGEEQEKHVEEKKKGKKTKE